MHAKTLRVPTVNLHSANVPNVGMHCSYENSALRPRHQTTGKYSQAPIQMDEDYIYQTEGPPTSLTKNLPTNMQEFLHTLLELYLTK